MFFLSPNHVRALKVTQYTDTNHEELLATSQHTLTQCNRQTQSQHIPQSTHQKWIACRMEDLAIFSTIFGNLSRK